MFFKRKKVQDWAKKVDKLITWLIIWWVVTSMIGLSKTNKWKKVSENIKTEWAKISKQALPIFWKVIAGVVKFFTKK